MNPMFPWAEQLREAMLRVGVDIGGMPVNDAMQVVVGRIASLTEQLEAARRDAKEAEACLGDGWQPIETAPRDGAPVLLWESEVEGICLGYHESWSWWNNFYEPWRFNPTHWMPLPEPPKESP